MDNEQERDYSKRNYLTAIKMLVTINELISYATRNDVQDIIEQMGKINDSFAP
jgi:hypothetical protein